MASDRHPAARAFNALALVAGVVGLVIVIEQLGWSGMRHAVLGTGAWFAVIAAIDLAGAMCDTFAIRSLLQPHAPVRFLRVAAAQLSGMAINRLTPASSLGEPVKVTLLVRGDVPVDTAVSSIVMFNLATIYVGIAAIVVGVPLTALLLDLPPAIERIVWIGLALLLAVAVSLVLLVRRGALGSFVDALARLRLVSPQRHARWLAQVATIDARVRSLGDASTPGVRRAIGGVVASRVCNWVGTIVLLHAADIPMNAPLVVAMLSVGILVNWIANVVPLGLGVADGTNYALYGVLGASPVAGLSFTMINRLRTIVVALMGIAVMLVATRVYGSRAATSPSQLA
jgi:hypothetical protein